MTNNKFFLIIAFFVVAANYLYGQTAMGSWRTHISYTDLNQITQSEEKIYAISTGSLFSIEKENEIIETYSKIYGLNDNNIHLIKYSDSCDMLFIAYSNSNIDLLKEDGSIINISDLYKKNMNGSKKINDICFDNKNAYIACDFGIIKLNVKKEEITETYIIGKDGNSEKIINIAIHSDSIYAMTTKSILVGSIKDNLLNYLNWKNLDNIGNGTDNVKMIMVDECIYVLKKDNTLYKKENNNWTQIKKEIKNISTSDNKLFTISTDGQLTIIDNNKSEFIADNAIDGLYDKRDNSVWYISNSLVFHKNLNTGVINHFLPNGPLSNTSWRLKYSNGRIFSIPGGRWAVNYYTPGSLSFFEDGIWHTYNTEYFTSRTETTGSCYDLVDIAINPNDKTHFWIASYGLGIYEFRNDEMYKFHHCDNSGLVSIYQDRTPELKYNYTRTDGMCYDDKGNLWILNNAGTVIKYIDQNGEYHKMPYSSMDKADTPQDIIVNNQNTNQKIILIPRYKNTTTSLLYSFDDNGTLNNIGDDKTIALTKVYDQDNKEIHFSAAPLLRSIAQDKKGVIWIGTTEGLLLINNPAKIFDPDFKAYRIKIPRNDGTGLADYLLGTEEIKAIAIDGANRKWIGTASSGVYLVSEDGLETIHHFTSENSPLLSNSIQALAINDKTGEVFISTGNGLISYQSDAIEGEKKFNNVHAYPNPVRPEYSGPITITGLVDNSYVRITDVNGNLIYETKSNGGVVTWDGCNNGEKVATGVYFAHCLSPDGKYKHITKILIVK